MNANNWKFLFILFLSIPVWLHAQKVNQKGIVYKINSGKETVSGVQLLFFGAPPTVTDNEGRFILTFNDIKYGNLIPVEAIEKKGFEVVNIQELREARLKRGELVVLLCPERLLDSMRIVYYNISIKTVLSEFQKKINFLEKQYAEKQLTKEEFLKEIEELKNKKEKAGRYAEELAERFARTNFDDVSDLYKHAFKLFEEGNIDSAIVVLEKEDLAQRALKRLAERKMIEGQLRYVENWKQENDSIKQIDVAAAKIAIEGYSQKKEYVKVDSLYKYIYQCDSTDISNIVNYTKFLLKQNHISRAQFFFEKIQFYDNIPDSIKRNLQQNFRHDKN